MIYVLTPEQVRIADSTAINNYNIPGKILMENAARSIAELIKSIVEENPYNYRNFAVFCGSGNNGGDGFALARHLLDYGYVQVYWIGDQEKMSEETRINFDILSNFSINIEHITTKEQIETLPFDFDLIIDALIGVGGTENLKGLVVDILEKIKETNCTKIAVDVPTGLNSETGQAHPYTFTADFTVTMFAPKTGMVIGNGPDYCGKIIVGKLGAPDFIVEDICRTFIVEKNDVQTTLPKRPRNSSKFDYGKVLIVAGSKKMPGAAALVANSAIKTGAGLVYLITPEVHPQILPEIIPFKFPESSEGALSFSNIAEILNFAANMDVIAIGPGMINNQDTQKIVAEIIKKRNKNIKILLDADAITPNLLKIKLDSKVLLTPHIGEFSRLIGIPREEIALNPLKYAKEWASKLKCTILLKGATSIITNGDVTFINNYGSPALSTAGSGDVLAGIIAGLLAQGLGITEAAAVGAYIHSMIGEYYSNKVASRGLTASKMVELIELIYNELEKKQIS